MSLIQTQTPVRRRGDVLISSALSDRFSIGSLIRRVEDFNLAGQLRTIKRLEDENGLLRRQIAFHNGLRDADLALLQDAYWCLTRIWQSLNVFDYELGMAQVSWFAHLGI